MVLNTTVAVNVETNPLKNVVVNGTTPLILNQLESLLLPLPQTPQSPPNIPLLGCQTTPLLSKFIEAQSEIWKHKYVILIFSLFIISVNFTFRTHHPVKVDGHTLSVAAIVAAARHAAPIRLDDCKRTKDRVEKSRRVVIDKVESGASVYGLSTGFGGSGMSYFCLPVIPCHSICNWL
jgi:phenylalanine ammonia-lyase